MNNPWDNLEKRLKAIANQQHNIKYSNVILLYIELIFDNENQLVGWYKPSYRAIEPIDFPVSHLIKGQRRLHTWQNTIERLKNEKISKTIVVLNTNPIGFL